MTDTKPTIGLSRRKMLAGLGAIGVASAGAGLGTTAYFSDQESFEGNTITAGELALSVTWQQLYYGGPQSSRPGDYGDAMRPFVNAYPDHDGNGLQSFEREDDDEDGTYVDQYAELDGEEDDEDRETKAKEGRNLEFACDEIATFDDIDFGERPDGSDQESLIELDDVKPGDCGEVTFGVKLCDNPGYVWLRGLLTYEESGDHPDGDQGTPQLADEIIARAWYDDGDNVFQEDEPTISSGTLRDVLEDLSDGRLLAFDPEIAEAPDDEMTEPVDSDAECIPLPKIDDDDDIDGLAPDDEFTFEVEDGEDVVITIVGVTYKDEDEDPEPVGFEWESNVPICQVNLKGGGDSPGGGEGLPTLYDCATSGTVNTTINPNNDKPYGISNFRFFYCDVDREEENGEEENGDVCFPPSNTQFIGFEWCLPTTVGNEVQGDTVAFDLSFYTEQCRHNPDPENPWAGESEDENATSD